jgi:hypothetical protein
VPCRVIFFTFLVTDASAAKFFDALGEARCAAITHVSADAATWIADEVADKCPGDAQPRRLLPPAARPPRRSVSTHGTRAGLG